MTRIRVDTEELRKSAKELSTAADTIGRAGDEILAVAISLPSYDGQLSCPARKAGYEIQSQTRDLRANLAGDADTLIQTAQEFEDVDGQTKKIFEDSRFFLSDSPLSLGDNMAHDGGGGTEVTIETIEESDGSTTVLRRKLLTIRMEQ